MKKRILLGSVLVAATSGVAAQTNVTMYGIVDAGINSTKVGDRSAIKLSEGGNAATQLGLRGSEDLGGGMKAIFDIQGGISLDTGDGNIPSVAGSTGFAFTRQAWMGLDASWGTITMGRQYTPMFIASARYDPFGSNALFGSVNLWYQATDQAGVSAMTVRQNNSIQYSLPARLPIKLNIMYGMGESDLPSRSSGNLLDITGGYASGPLSIMLSHQERKSGTAAAPVAAPVTSKSDGVFANYSFGPARVGVNFGKQKSDATGAVAAKLYGAGLSMGFAGNWTALAHVQKRDVEGTTNDQTAYTLGLNYELSKRTSLYGRFLNLNNGGTARLQLAGYTIPAGNLQAGEEARSIMVGMRHNF